ncbi:MAG TPA: sulfatase-like hydrolase/transferase [Thermoleophilaceae bacterium]
MTRWEVVAFALFVALVPALVLTAVEALAGLASVRARDTLHIVFVAFLAAVAALQFVRNLDAPSGIALLIALAIGAGVAALYSSKDGVRTAFGYLMLAPIFFVISFLFIGETSSLVLKGNAEAYSTKAQSTPPIVLITFDAFPVQDLLDHDGEIDRARYPNLARLADTATWFPNATSAHENTTLSVPSILDGNWPKKDAQPIVADHPNNLFTLLGKTYEMNVTEVATNLCPPGLCSRTNKTSFGDRADLVLDDSWIVFKHLAYPKHMRSKLPVISDRWRDFGQGDTGAEKTGKTDGGGILQALGGGGRPATFLQAVQRIRPTKKPELNFAHVLLPHEPRQYFEDGRSYQRGSDPDPSLDGPESFNVPFLTEQAHQRVLLQIGYTDRLVGRLLDRLESTGMFDETLLVIVADHGESFDVKKTPAESFAPGKLSWRRAVTQSNVHDIAPIPLFVKYPGEDKGKVDRRWVKTIDVLPTIADTLGMKLPFKVDGRSLRDPSYKGRPDVEMEQTNGHRVRMSITQFESRKRASLQRRLAQFGAGSWKPVYDIGPRTDLIGRSITAKGGAGPDVSVQFSDVFASVEPDTGVVPAHVRGRLSNKVPAGSALAFALNGRIVATGSSFKPVGRYKVEFTALLPANAFVKGRNKLDIFRVDGESLTRIGGV